MKPESATHAAIYRMAGMIWLVLLACLLSARPSYGGMPDTIERIMPGIVGIGTVQKTRRPAAKLTGTGFVVGDGRHVITNAQVIPDKIDGDKLEFLAVFSGKGMTPKARQLNRAIG